jgi:hypothetical protein
LKPAGLNDNVRRKIFSIFHVNQPLAIHRMVIYRLLLNSIRNVLLLTTLSAASCSAADTWTDGFSTRSEPGGMR